MKKPLVSVVMPTLNSARFIRETIHSLIDQVYTRFELIVVDGGSTDDTIKIVESYKGDGDLKLLRLSAEEGTIPKSLNAGLALADGEFIARMDADDIAYPTRFLDQVDFFIKLPEVDLLGTGADLFWGQDGACRSPQWHDHIENSFLINNPFFHPTIMFRRKLYDSGLFYYAEDQFCDEDYELWGRLIPKARCANLDQSSIRYRIHNQNSQWDPRKHRSKQRALRGFCDAYGVDDPALVDALVEFQCSGFLRYENFLVLRDYAANARQKKLPELGWIHNAILRENSYSDFQSWYRAAKGWAA